MQDTPARPTRVVNIVPEVDAAIPKTGPLRSYMQWVTKTTDAEHVFHLGSILPCAAHVACEHGFVVDEERLMKPNVWTFMVGIPASSKSTAQLRSEKLYTAARNTWLGGQGDIPFVSAEGSLPGIFDAMRDRYDAERGITSGILMLDEAARLLGMKDDSVADFLCRVIDGGDFKRNLRSLQEATRAGGVDRSLLRNGAFSGRMATTFQRLEDVTSLAHIEGGLYSRFLWFVGAHHVVNPVFRIEMHEAEAKRVRDEWIDWRNWLLAQRTADDLAKDRGYPPGVVPVTDEAYDLLERTLWRKYVKASRGPQTPLLPALKRSMTQAVTLAGLYALSERETSVRASHMDPAISAVRLSLDGLERLLPGLATVESVRDAERVLRAIKTIEGRNASAEMNGAESESRKNGVPKSMLYSATRLPKRTIDEAVMQLIDANEIVRVTPRRTGRGRPSEVFYTVTTYEQLGLHHGDDVN